MIISIEKEPVSFIMSTNLVALNQTDTIFKAHQIFASHSIQHLPVISDHHLVGMVSKNDLLNAEKFCDINTTTISEVMIKHVLCISPDTTIKEVCETFVRESFHALPVLKDDIIVGIVTTTDIIKFLLRKG